MKSPAAAIGWEIWARNQWAFVMIAGVMVFVGAFESIAAGLLGTSRAHLLEHPSLTDYGDEVGLVIFFVLVTMMATLIACLVLFSYTETAYRNGEPRFPERTFHLPIRTSWLAGIPMIFAAVSITSIYLVWRQFILLPVGIILPATLPVCSLVMATLGLQALIWGLPGLPALRLLALSFVFTLFLAVNFCMLAETRIPAGSSSILDTLTPPWRAGQVAVYNRAAMGLSIGLSIISLVMGVHAVERHRRGKWRGFKSEAVAAPHGIKGRPQTFSSRTTAQFWFEWRRNGALLPYAVTSFYAMLLLVIPLLTKMDASTTLRVFIAAIALPVLLSAVVGVGFGKLDFWSKEFALSPFLSNWPIREGEIIAAKLKVAAAAVVISWTVGALSICLWLFFWCDASQITYEWQNFLKEMPTGSSQITVILGAAAALVISWRFLIANLHWGIWGRPKYFLAGAAGASLVGLAVIVLGVLFFTSNNGGAYRRLVYFPLLPWLIAFAVTTKFTVAACAFGNSLRRGLVSLRFVVGYVFFWLLATATLLAGVVMAVPYEGWKQHLFMFALVLAVPLARIGVSPILLSWNRHQRLRLADGKE